MIQRCATAAGRCPRAAQPLDQHFQPSHLPTLTPTRPQDEIEGLERLLRDRGQALPEGSAELDLHVVSIFAAMSPDKQLAVFAQAPPGTRKARGSTPLKPKIMHAERQHFRRCSQWCLLAHTLEGEHGSQACAVVGVGWEGAQTLPAFDQPLVTLTHLNPTP